MLRTKCGVIRSGCRRPVAIKRRRPCGAAEKAHIDCEKRNAMKWEVHGMRKGRPGKWTVEAPSSDIAREKAEAAGVTLGRVEQIGQITSATVALALSPRMRPGKPRRQAGWIAACIACAIAFGAGGYLLGYQSARIASPRVEATPASANEPTADAITAAAVEKEGTRMSLRK